MTRLIVIVAMAATGCSTSPVPPSAIAPPSARLMVPPAALASIQPGSDLVVEHLKLRRQYAAETARLKSLQTYVRIVRRGQR